MDATPTYRERLSVPLRWWVQGTMLVASLWLAVVVAVPEALAWAITGVAVALLAALTAGLRLPRDQRRRRRAARRPGPHRGAPPGRGCRRSTPRRTRRAAGVEADARAYLLLRPYRKRAVRVEVADPADPTPYWLLSSRRPDDLAEVLRRLTPRVAPPSGSTG